MKWAFLPVKLFKAQNICPFKAATINLVKSLSFVVFNSVLGVTFFCLFDFLKSIVSREDVLTFVT